MIVAQEAMSDWKWQASWPLIISGPAASLDIPGDTTVIHSTCQDSISNFSLMHVSSAHCIPFRLGLHRAAVAPFAHLIHLLGRSLHSPRYAAAVMKLYGYIIS